MTMIECHCIKSKKLKLKNKEKPMNLLKIISALTVITFFMASTGQAAPMPVAEVKKVVAEKLRDPESARFTKIYTPKGTNRVCGVVAGKNGFGGYGDKTPFIVMEDAVMVGADEPEALLTMMVLCKGLGHSIFDTLQKDVLGFIMPEESFSGE